MGESPVFISSSSDVPDNSLSPILDIGEKKKIYCFGAGSTESDSIITETLQIEYSVLSTTAKYVVKDDLYLVGKVSSFTCGTSSGGFHDGDGSLDDPYQICNCNQLQTMNNSLAANYSLIADIDCTRFDAGDGNGFWPIGLSDDPFSSAFTGTFDGRMHTIRGISMDRRGSSFSLDGGIFSIPHNAIIKNVAIVDASIYVNSLGGCLMAVLDGTNVSQVYTDCDVSCDADYCSPFIADFGDIEQSSLVSNFKIAGSVSAASYVSTIIPGDDFVEAGSRVDDGYSVAQMTIGGSPGVALSNCNWAPYTNVFTVNNNSNYGFSDEDCGTNLINDYWWNTTTNGNFCDGGDDSGCTAIEDYTDFYNPSNEPMASWSSGKWYFSGDTYPRLKGLG